MSRVPVLTNSRALRNHFEKNVSLFFAYLVIFRKFDDTGVVDWFIPKSRRISIEKRDEIATLDLVERRDQVGKFSYSDKLNRKQNYSRYPLGSYPR